MSMIQMARGFYDTRQLTAQLRALREALTEAQLTGDLDAARGVWLDGIAKFETQVAFIEFALDRVGRKAMIEYRRKELDKLVEEDEAAEVKLAEMAAVAGVNGASTTA